MAEVPEEIARGFLPYNAEAPILRTRYSAMPFEEKHLLFQQYYPAVPSDILDVGTGIGVDAFGFAERGHRVVAVEPAQAMRAVAMAERDHPNIIWVDDHLPHLARVREMDRSFDFILTMASFMHLSPTYQANGMEALNALTKPGGHLGISLRHGPVPAGRTMYEISDEMALALGSAAGFACVAQETGRGGKIQPGVTWSYFVFRKL